MKILFYTPLNTRCRDLESQAAAFVKNGHTIFLLTQSRRGPLHENFSGYGYETGAQKLASRPLVWRVILQVVGLAGFCRRNDIDLVYAHLEPANFVAVLAQFFIRSRVIICRHHIDEARLYGFDRSLSYRLTYRWARTIIVVSEHARAYMIETEKIDPAKIFAIRLAYDFSLYVLPDAETVAAARQRHPGKIKLIDVCRLTAYKRPFELLALARLLLSRKIPFHLTILGQGELMDDLRKQILEDGLEQHVEMPGYVSDVMLRLASSDLLVHPSVLESSCISVKESGLVGLPVVVCRGVGDFDDTLRHGWDSCLVDRAEFVRQTADYVEAFQAHPSPIRQTGVELGRTIRRLFAIEQVAGSYDRFHL